MLNVGLAEGSPFSWQDFVSEVTARCKVTGFVTGNISEHYMKGLATDIESLLKVRSSADSSIIIVRKINVIVWLLFLRLGLLLERFFQKLLSPKFLFPIFHPPSSGPKASCIALGVTSQPTPAQCIS